MIETNIALAVTETNTSYAWSDVSTRLRMVKVEEVDYTEYDPDGPSVGTNPCLSGCDGPFDAALDDLRNGDNGLDIAERLRNAYGADMVALIIDDTQYCGLAAGILPGADQAYQVTAWNCATGYYSFGHEFGHLQGAHHDAFVVSPGNRGVTIDGTFYNYNLGWTNTTDWWRTIMAYNNACSDAGGTCPRLQRWSNPNKSFEWVEFDAAADAGPADAMGGPTAKNYDILSLSASTVAGWRRSLGDEFNTQFNGKAPGWRVKNGTWWFADNKQWVGEIGAGQTASVVRNRRFGDFTFTARMKRKGCFTCSNKLIVRGKSKKTTANGTWRPWICRPSRRPMPFTPSPFRFRPTTTETPACGSTG